MLCGFYLYAHRGARYFAGVAIHSRQFPVGSDSENSSSDASCDVSKNHDDDAPTRHTSCAWWLYGEQPLWTTDGKAVLGMVQYSENTNRNSTCYRYAEIGCAYRDDRNECGLSGQYARYYNGTEYSAEVTWKHKLTESIAFGPVSSISAIAMETTPSPVCASIVISDPSQLLSHKKC